MLQTESPGFQFMINLQDVNDPPVWRRVVVPSHYNFKYFHVIIQDVFGWFDDHLYCFSPKGWGSVPMIQEVEEFGNGKNLLASGVKLSDIFTKENQTFTYIYDFGDDWKHHILLEKILAQEISRPECTAGEGNCPPEDCGGAPGYNNLKIVFSDPNHPGSNDLKNWPGLPEGEQWDPEYFDLQLIQRILAKTFSTGINDADI